MDTKLRNIPQNWKVSIHNQYNISCHDCHGGDPTDRRYPCRTAEVLLVLRHMRRSPNFAEMSYRNP
jgi:hypothetical protein